MNLSVSLPFNVPPIGPKNVREMSTYRAAVVCHDRLRSGFLEREIICCRRGRPIIFGSLFESLLNNCIQDPEELLGFGDGNLHSASWFAEDVVKRPVLFDAVIDHVFEQIERLIGGLILGSPDCNDPTVCAYDGRRKATRPAAVNGDDLDKDVRLRLRNTTHQEPHANLFVGSHNLFTFQESFTAERVYPDVLRASVARRSSPT